MPVEFLSDAEAAAFGRFDGAPCRDDLDRFFFLDHADLELIDKRRGSDNRLGFALQREVLDLKLIRDIPQRGPGHVTWIGQKRAQETNPAQLDRRVRVGRPARWSRERQGGT